MDKEKKQLRVIAFYDGRPGHEKQTRGILQELEKRARIDVEEIFIHRRKNLLEEIGDLAVLLFCCNKKSLHNTYGQVDLLIGTGTHTHVPMLKLKKKTGAHAVICMSPASYLLRFFDLCFVPYHDGGIRHANVVRTIGPPNCAVASNEKDSNRGLILIGGIDGKSHLWDPVAIEDFIQTIAEREPTVHWTVASSPRTPKETIERVDAIANEIENVIFYRFENTGPGWIEAQYAQSLKVWVTADSMSMVYEALSAGCQVGLLPIQWMQKKSKFKRSEEYLIGNGLVVSFSQWLAGKARWSKNEPLNEARHCAEVIVEKWLSQKN